jgi:N-acetylmuramoyl-L-alanine amidase
MYRELGGDVAMPWKEFKVLSRRDALSLIANLDVRRAITFVVLHHSDRPSKADFERRPDPSYWLEAIDRVHRMRGFACIGYHFVIFPTGEVGLGRDINQVGAHVKGHNTGSVGVCLIGNFNTESLEGEQYISMKYVLAALLRKLALSPERLFFHRDFNPTDCPGSRLERETVRAVVEATMKTLKG